MKDTGFFGRHGNILVYVPNLIGYARITFATSAFAVAPRQPLACLLLYGFSFVCDELDGRAARAFNQTSSLGAVLDMLTDRLSTAGLLVLLCIRIPSWYLLFLGLMFLDIFSHWLQMHSTLVAGHISHKQSFNQSWLVQIYYTQRIFMGFCCICCEILYLAIYMLTWQNYREGSAFKFAAALGYGEQKTPAASYIAIAALPGTLVKQMINVVQLRAACRALITFDQQEDALSRQKAKQ